MLRGLEWLESRRLLTASQGDGTEAVSWTPPPSMPDDGAVADIVWNGTIAEARADRWNGRLADAFNPMEALEALPLPSSTWRAVSLGNGFFSLSTPGATQQDVLTWAGHTPGLLSLEPDFVLAGAALPDDTGFVSQWSLSNDAAGGFGVVGADIHATEAWDITTGSRSVVVAVIDSGIDLTHPDLAANIWTNPGEIAGNGIDDDRNGFVDDVHGWNFAGNDSDVQDGYGHGTHVSGIIGAVGHNGLGVTGISWQVSIMPLRFQDSLGMGSTGGAVAALNYATMMRRDFGVNVVVTNASWGGGTGLSEMLQEAIRAQGEAGITFVAAAGNSGANCDAIPRYPACFDMPNVISVAASDRYDSLAGFSNYGATTIDLAAPGVGIYSTRPSGSYAFMSGTSQAAPQVTGVVALLAAAKPGITVAEVRAAILGSVDPVPSLAGKTVTGGRLDAAAALMSLSGQSFAARVRVGQSSPFSGVVDSITIAFTRAVASGFDLADLSLFRDGVLIPLDGVTLTTTDNLTWTLTGLARLTTGVGNYSITVSGAAGNSGITGPNGEPLDVFTGASWIVANRLPIGTIDVATAAVVKGWALDPNAGNRPIAVQVWVDGRIVATETAVAQRDDLAATYGSVNHGYAIAMPPLPLGNHLVEVKAIDLETGVFVSLGQRAIAVQPPVGVVQIATIRRLTGWAFSSRAGEAPIMVRVTINGRMIGNFVAALPRPDLQPRLGSAGHGFDIALNPGFFRRGANVVRVFAIDPLTARPTLISAKIVRR